MTTPQIQHAEHYVEQPDKELQKQVIEFLYPHSKTHAATVSAKRINDLMSLIESHAKKTETYLMARLQAEVISPNIDEMFGTIDHKGVASKLLEFVEAELEKETP